MTLDNSGVGFMQLSYGDNTNGSVSRYASILFVKYVQ